MSGSICFTVPGNPVGKGRPRVQSSRAVSGIGERLRDSTSAFRRIFANLAAESGPPDRVMIDSTHLKAHRTAASLLKRGIHPVSSAARKAG